MHHNQIDIGPEKDQPAGNGDKIEVRSGYPNGGLKGTIVSWASPRAITVMLDGGMDVPVIEVYVAEALETVA